MAYWHQQIPSAMGPNRRGSAIPASHLKEVQVNLVGQSFSFHIDRLFPNIWGKSKQEWQLLNYIRQVIPYEIPSADLGCLLSEDALRLWNRRKGKGASYEARPLDNLEGSFCYNNKKELIQLHPF